MTLFQRLALILGLAFAPMATAPVAIGTGVFVATTFAAEEVQACTSADTECHVHRCPNGIILRNASTMSQAAIASACDRKLGGAGATKVAEGCIKMEVGRVPRGTTNLIVAVYSPATFREACGAKLCQNCIPDHSEWGKPDLAAELPIVDGYVQVPASWFQGKRVKAWLCIPDTNLSVALHKEHLIYLLAHRSTPYGDPLRWAKSRFMVN